MRLLILIATAALALAAPAVAAAPKAFKVTIATPTRKPKINVHWPYVVKVTDLQGKALAGTLSLAIVDPIGQVHPVEYSYSKTKTVTNVPIKGVFRDYIIWPLASAGYPLKFRATVKTAKGKAVVVYIVTPHQ